MCVWVCLCSNHISSWCLFHIISVVCLFDVFLLLNFVFLCALCLVLLYSLPFINSWQYNRTYTHVHVYAHTHAKHKQTHTKKESESKSRRDAWKLAYTTHEKEIWQCLIWVAWKTHRSIRVRLFEFSLYSLLLLQFLLLCYFFLFFLFMHVTWISVLFLSFWPCQTAPSTYSDRNYRSGNFDKNLHRKEERKPWTERIKLTHTQMKVST